jgi:hypothetical protein
VSTPSWTLDIFAVVMVVVAAVSAARLVLARRWRPAGAGPEADIDAAHALMGIAMAGMLVASLTTLPNDAWDVIFAIMTAWFAWSVYRESRARRSSLLAQGHHVPHLVHSAAMLYMFVAVTAHADSGGMSGMGGSAATMRTLQFPVLALFFAILLAGFAVLDIDRLTGPAHGRAVSAGIAPADAVLAAVPVTVLDVLLDPRLAAGCRIAMGITMALMLVIMI